MLIIPVDCDSLLYCAIFGLQVMYAITSFSYFEIALLLKLCLLAAGVYGIYISIQTVLEGIVIVEAGEEEAEEAEEPVKAPKDACCAPPKDAKDTHEATDEFADLLEPQTKEICPIPPP